MWFLGTPVPKSSSDPVPSDAWAQHIPAPIPVPRVRVVRTQLVPTQVPWPAKALLMPAALSILRVGPAIPCAGTNSQGEIGIDPAYSCTGIYC